jgi:hypothetical protein
MLRKSCLVETNSLIKSFMIATGIQEVHRQEGDCVSTLRYFMDELPYSGKFSRDKIFTNGLFPEIRG